MFCEIIGRYGCPYSVDEADECPIDHNGDCPFR